MNDFYDEERRVLMWASISEVFVDSVDVYKPGDIYTSKPKNNQYLYMILEIPEYYIESYQLLPEQNKCLKIHLESNDGKIIENIFYFGDKDVHNKAIDIKKKGKELAIGKDVYPVHEILLTDGLLIEAELLYIGKGIKSSAIERLRNHSTLQKILAKNNDKIPRKEIWIVTFSINEKKYLETYSPLELSNNKLSSFGDYSRKESLVNITEASLINYFKPMYNTEFTKNVVPSSNHISYNEYYEKKVNSMIINLELLSKFILKTDTQTFNPDRDMISNSVDGNLDAFERLSCTFLKGKNNL